MRAKWSGKPHQASLLQVRSTLCLRYSAMSEKACIYKQSKSFLSDKAFR